MIAVPRATWCKDPFEVYILMLLDILVSILFMSLRFKEITTKKRQEESGKEKETGEFMK